MESAGETILSVPPLLHLLAIQQQQQKGNSAQNNAEGEVSSSSSSSSNDEVCSLGSANVSAIVQQQQQQMQNVMKQQEANDDNKSASAGLASDEEDRLEHKQQLLSQDDEDDDFVGKLEIVEDSTTPPSLFRQQQQQILQQLAEEEMHMKIDPPKDLQIQIPPVNGAAFVGGRHHHHTASSLLMPTDDPSTPTDQTLKALPVIKPPGDEKEERPSLSYKDLIIEAIESSPERRLKLSEIYQVIKYLHPYYQRRSDQWGWQNSIRHNLSLHDCFVKLPLKQTSANGVVGHFWTVVTRGPDEKPLGPTRRRTRGTGKAKKGASMAHNGGRQNAVPNLSSGTKHGTIKGLKGRQSVSSDSGVMSDEGGACSHSNSPTELGTRSVPLLHAHTESVAASARPQFSANLFQFSHPTSQTPTIQQQHHVQAVHSPLPAATAAVYQQHQPVQQQNSVMTPLELVMQLTQQHTHQQLQAVQQQPLAPLQQFSPVSKMTAAEVSAPAASTPSFLMPTNAVGGANGAFSPCDLQQLLTIAALTQQHQQQVGAVSSATQPQQQQQHPVVAVSAAANTNNGNNNNNSHSIQSSPPPPDTTTLLQLLNPAGTSSGGPPDGGLGLLSHLAAQLAPTRGSPAPFSSPQHQNNNSPLALAAAAATAELQRLHMIQLYAQQQQQQLQQQLAALLEQQQQQLQFRQQETTTSNPHASLADALAIAGGHEHSALVVQLFLSKLMHSPTASSTSSSTNNSSSSSSSTFEHQQQQMNVEVKSSPTPPPPPQNNNTLQLLDLQRAAFIMEQQQYQQVQAQQVELSNNNNNNENSNNRREVQAVQQLQQHQSMDTETKQELDQQQELTVV
uniref:Fork-head domain-containing protein n=1 Tax=Globodera rostochiensis TaxID=31243 RepID=A0A914GZ36_GLORO